MASGCKNGGGAARTVSSEQTCEESSESDGETEPAKSFHRRLSTNREIKRAATIKEGFLMKQTWSFQRWRRRYFKLKGRKLYYAKDTEAVIFDEIDLSDLSFAECSIKNVNHSFQVITPFRRLVMCAESRREMEAWTSALRAASSREYYETGDYQDIGLGNHRWYSTSHARPTYCNVCKDALSGVASHGLSCEVCKFKVHKRCAVKAINNCKWTTLGSIGKDIIEDEDRNITMPHQWMEGNLPVSAKCAVCDKTCGSVMRLQDWRCLWCRATVHTACRPFLPIRCPLGPCRVSVVPPIALHRSAGSDEPWEAVRLQSCSPLLVFVNSKSGDNQGVKFLRRFKQLLNPAQVFDLISNGPGLGLRLFRHFDPFRILVCSGDGSVGWVLSEIDRLNMHQCQVGVLPLGTGNDLARVLGWGSSCDDDTHLPQLLEKYEKACTKMLDRWSIMAFEKSINIPTRKPSHADPSVSITAYEDSVVSHLTKILQSDQHSVVISSAKTLCEAVKDFIMRAAEVSLGQGDQQFGDKCQVLKEKLDLLLQTLQYESGSLQQEEASSLQQEELQQVEVEVLQEEAEKGVLDRPEKYLSGSHELRKSEFMQRDALMSRANSLKKAIRQLVEHTEQAVDEQNKTRAGPCVIVTPPPPDQHQQRRTSKTLDIPGLPRPTNTLKVLPTIESLSSTEASPSLSPLALSHSSSPDITPFSNLLTAISPLPDMRRDSGCSEDLLTLPVPVEFADEEARRRSLVPSEDDTCSPTFTPSDVELQDLAMTPAKPMQRFLSPPDDLIQVIPDVGDEAKRILSCKEEKNKGNLLAAEESVHKSFDEQLQKAVSQLHVNLSVDASDSGSAALSSPQDVQGEAPQMDLLIISDIKETRRSSTVSLKDMEKDMSHIDSPEAVEPEQEDEDMISGLHVINPDHSEAVNMQGELAMAGRVDVSEIPITPSSTEDVSPMSPKDHSDSEEEEEGKQVVKGCSLAHFEEGNDIARRSFYRQIRSGVGRKKRTATGKLPLVQHSEALTEHDEYLNVVKVQIQGSNNNLSAEAASTPDSALGSHRPSLVASEADDEELYQYHIQAKQREALAARHIKIPVKAFPPMISVIVDPPSPVMSDDGDDMLLRFSEDTMNRLSVMSPTSGLNCSPAATRRISSGSLLKAPDAVIAAGTKAASGRSRSRSLEKDSRFEERSPTKRLPIINPLVRSPMWPNVSAGAGLVSKVLLANADALCAAASPLMDPDETLLEGYYERAVMNNYFGIGIDAKISLDFHQKREEHPEKCRSRAKNYMWYGVLGSKEWLQKTYKNLEQRVQLECDGQRIPLPSLQGIVILNIPSFMGGTNFWGGTKEDDCFLAPSFDDRILEVVAVFGSVQMAASRLINLQHHRIAQCQTVQITILGEEGVPIQVDGEAWVQPPGMIRIIHKNRMQMLCRNKALETSLRAWEEKQRHQQSLLHSQSSLGGKLLLLSPFIEEEKQQLLGFIESVTTLVKYVKLLTITHPTIEVELYQLAAETAANLEKVHPGGKILEGPNLRPQVTELVASTRQLYEETCNLLREKAHNLRLREDLEGKLSAALCNIEMELRKCVTYDSAGLVQFQQPVSEEQGCSERKGRARGLSWLKFRRGGGGSSRTARDVATWGVTEVATWLETLQLSEYAESFTCHDIRGRELLTLGRRDLKELGVTKVGHVKRILQAVKDLTM
ncbi:diacylglycerol kinase eta isoform X3 [Cryptotermes secundus]|uniref:diacylglycerol kinase eta isoform X3 n=1 Tax=Cryptotermes secundus TaxID=105785 RepID=UPI000CD7C315|nr:diacylglycerol kinase eta isoform X3 [Cryptotermes secundus]